MSFVSTKLGAARLALMALRAAQPTGVAVPDLYRLGSSQVLLSAHDAARQLADLPKPVACEALVADRALHITCRPLADPAALMEWRTSREFWEERGGPYALLLAPIGANYGEASALCVGRGERLVVPVRALEAWEAEYVLPPNGCTADVPGSMWADLRGLTASAQACGAAVVVEFLPAEERPYITDSGVIEFDDPAV